MTPSPAGPGDAPRLAILHAAAFERAWSAEDLAAMMREGAVALAKREGFILLRIFGLESEILTIAVDPGARRQGVGRALLGAALQAAAERGVQSVFLEVAEDNPAAAALYAGAGFEPIGRRRAYYPRVGGAAVDALALRLRLPPATP